MDILIFSQTLFYFVASIAIIVLGVLLAISTYNLIYITKHLRNISDRLDDATEEIRTRIEEIVEKLSSLPILSYFLKKERKYKNDTHNKKGRNLKII